MKERVARAVLRVERRKMKRLRARGKEMVKRRERGSEEVSVPAMCGGQFVIVHQLMTSWMKTILN